MIDKSEFTIDQMNPKRDHNRCCITQILKRRGKTIELKRKMIMIANTPLFYAFGYEYEPPKEYLKLYGVENEL